MKDLQIVSAGKQDRHAYFHGGEPVFPFCSSEEKELLLTIASLFGARIVDYGNTEGLDKAGSQKTKGCVLAWNNEFAADAGLYAQLTGRKLATKKAPARKGRDRLEVVMIRNEDLHSDVFHDLYQKNDYCPGIIAASTAEDMRLKVLQFAAYAYLLKSSQIEKVSLIAPEIERDYIELDDHVQLIEKASSREDVLNTMRASHDVLMISTHSDGIDSFLHKDLVLCSVFDRSQPVPTGGSPRCSVTGHCHRKHAPIAELKTKEYFFSPKDVQAKLMIWGVCNGVLASTSEVNSHWSLGWHFHGSMKVGCMITTWVRCQASLEQIMQVYGLLELGYSAGEAVGFVNSTNQTSGSFLCIMGDPSSQFERTLQLPTIASLVKETPKVEFVELPAVSGRDDADFILNWMRLICSAKYHYHSITKAQDFAKKVCEMIETGSGDWHGLLLDYFAKRGHNPNDWIVRAEAMGYKDVTCGICGSQSKDHIYKVREGLHRKVSICPNCGIIGDQAPEQHFLLRVTDTGSVEIKGDFLPHVRYKARLIFWSSHPELSKSFDWPLSESGQLLEQFAPNYKPIGLCNVIVAVVWEKQLALAAHLTSKLSQSS